MTVLIDRDATRAALPWGHLIDGLRDMFRTGCEAPLRHHHDFAVPGEDPGTLLLMPAWTPGDYLGVKMLAVVPGNAARGLPSIAGSYLLSSAATGEPLALIDGAELTARRTAAVSALAASYLARADAERLLIVGAGRLSLNLIQAHSETRPIGRVDVWARRLEQAEAVVADARAMGYQAYAVKDLERAAGTADIVSCCTLSREPLIRGHWLRPEAHLDLIGAFKPEMRESDNTAIIQGRVFADTREGALSEAGDLVQPIRDGFIGADHVLGDLFDLCRGAVPGRIGVRDFTVFKSVGAALEDLAAARCAYEAFAASRECLLS